jgi:outer membrane protein assembly factor BamB
VKKIHNDAKAKATSLGVLLVSVFLLTALAGVLFVGKVSAVGPYDWPMYSHNPQHTGYSESPAPNTNQTLWTYTTDGMVQSSPAVANGKLYVGSNDNNVYCLDAATGNKVWNYTTGDDAFSSPAVADGKVYTGSNDDKVYCFDALTGALVWNYTTGGNVRSSPTVTDGKVYVGSADKNFYCLNAATGTKIWNYTLDAEANNAAMASGRVYVGSMGNITCCLNASTGALIWNFTPSGIVITTSVADGKVYFGSDNNNVYCFDATTGVKLWNFTTGGDVYSCPTIASGKIYVGSADNNVYCLDAATGSKAWNYTTGGDVYSSSAAIADGKVYVNSLDRNAYCLNAATGAFIWSYTTGHQMFYSSPAIANGVVYVSSSDRNVYAFSSGPPVSALAWSKTYGGTSSDTGTGETVQTSDGGYAISGDTYSFGAGSNDFWLFKTDAYGSILWNKTYGGALGEISGDMCKTNDGGYAIAGGTSSFGAGSQDVYLVKTDANGNMLWNKTYGGSGYEYGYHLVQTPDGGYAVTGYTGSFGAGGQDAWLIKTDANGNMLWNKTYGGTATDQGVSLIQTSDGGYAISGFTGSFGAGGQDAWLIKTDANGNMLWNKTYGGNTTDQALSLVQSGDGGYALAGYTNSLGAGGQDAWLIKTDTAGNMLWNKTYGGSANDGVVHMIQTADGGYALAGWGNTSEVLLVKTDAMGNMQWNQTYGGAGTDIAYALLQASDGGYLLTGNTNSFGAGSYDVLLVKVDSSGVVPEGLTIAVIMLLSSIAALAGKLYFRKPPRIAK